MGMLDNYPPGLTDYTPGCPWTEAPDNDPIDVEVSVSTTLSKDTIIQTDNYTASEWEDWDNDDEGGYVHTGGVDYDFSDTCFIEEYEKCELTIPQLLEELVKLAQEKIDTIKNSQEFSASGKTKNGKKIQEIRRLQGIIDNATGWTEDETEVIQS